MSFDESLGCVVVWYRTEWPEPACWFAVWFPLAVTPFHRFSRFVEALKTTL